MTVSCNCQDYDGTGHLGDLSKRNLQEIFDGKIAMKFRNMLSKGKLPILTCSRCPELKSIPKDSEIKPYTIPHKGIMIENTIRCNLRCRSCPRESVVSIRQKLNLSISNLRNISSLIKKYGIKKIAYFNLGEPFLSSKIYEELKIIKDLNNDLKINISQMVHY